MVRHVRSALVLLLFCHCGLLWVPPARKRPAPRVALRQGPPSVGAPLLGPDGRALRALPLRLQMSEDRLKERVASYVKVLKTEMSPLLERQKIEGLTRFLHNFVKQKSRKKLLPLHPMLGLALRSMLPSASPETLAITSLALCYAGVREGSAWQELAKSVASGPQGFNPRALAELAWSFSEVRYAHQGVFQTLLRKMEEVKQMANEQEKSVFCWASGNLGFNCSAIFGPPADSVDPQLSRKLFQRLDQLATNGGIQILAKDPFPLIFGSTSTFGAPFYGDRVYGRLVYGTPKQKNHCTEEDYDVPSPEKFMPAGKSYNEVRLINIILVERGSCSFVTKVKVAQKKEAHAVIIVDTQGSTRTTRDIQDIIVADDGYGSNVDIPSVLISREEGQKLIDPLLADPGTQVVVELNWDIPSENVVQVDLWMSSASVSSQKFLKDFKPKREALNEYLRFMPHYHVFSMDGSKDYKELCFDVSGKYCAEDPDGSGSVTGYVVLMEDVRQLCIHELYTKSMDERISYQQHPTSESALYAAEWWRYASNYLDECPLDGKSENAKFGPTCSLLAMKKFGIHDVEKVEACVAQTAEQKLQQQLTFTAWSPRALRINGWRYNGQLDGDLVTRAICSGFVETPQKCKALIEPRNPFLPFAQSKETGVSFSQMVEAIVATALFGICIMYFYKRALTRHVHTALREEVMLEVQSEMARYKQLGS